MPAWEQKAVHAQCQVFAPQAGHARRVCCVSVTSFLCSSPPVTHHHCWPAAWSSLANLISQTWSATSAARLLGKAAKQQSCARLLGKAAVQGCRATELCNGAVADAPAGAPFMGPKVQHPCKSAVVASYLGKAEQFPRTFLGSSKEVRQPCVAARLMCNQAAADAPAQGPKLQHFCNCAHGTSTSKVPYSSWLLRCFLLRGTGCYDIEGGRAHAATHACFGGAAFGLPRSTRPLLSCSVLLHLWWGSWSDSCAGSARRQCLAQQ